MHGARALWLTAPVHAVCTARRYPGTDFAWKYGFWSTVIIIVRVLASAINLDRYLPGRLTFRYTFALLMYAHITLLLVWVGLALVWLTLSAIIDPAKNLVMAAAILAPMYSLRALWNQQAFLRKDVAGKCTDALNAVLLSKVAGHVQSKGAMKSVHTANRFIRELVCPKGAPIPTETIFRALDPRNWKTASLSIESKGDTGGTHGPRNIRSDEKFGGGQYTFGTGKYNADDEFAKVHKKITDDDESEAVYINIDQGAEVEICYVEESLATQAKRMFADLAKSKDVKTYEGVKLSDWAEGGRNTTLKTKLKEKFISRSYHQDCTKLDELFKKLQDVATPVTKEAFNEAVDNEEVTMRNARGESKTYKKFDRTRTVIRKITRTHLLKNTNENLNYNKFSGRTKTRLSVFIPLGSELRGIRVRSTRRCASTRATPHKATRCTHKHEPTRWNLPPLLVAAVTAAY